MTSDAHSPTFSGHLSGNTGTIIQLLVDDSHGYNLALRRENRTLIAYVGEHEYSRGEMFPADGGFTCALVEPTLKNELRLVGRRDPDGGYLISVEVWIHDQWLLPWEERVV